MDPISLGSTSALRAYINPKYYIPRPEAPFVEEQFEEDNRELILFISGSSGVGKSTLVRKCVEKEQNVIWIECRTTTDPSKLPIQGLTENQNLSCVVFDDASELLFGLYKDMKFSENKGSSSSSTFLSMCASLALRRVKLVFISCNYADAIRFREIFPGPGAMRRITRIHFGCVTASHAQKVLEARTNKLNPTEIKTVMEDFGGKFSDLVELAGAINSGGAFVQTLERLKAEKKVYVKAKLTELHCTRIPEYMQNQNLTSLQLFQLIATHSNNNETSDVVDKLVWSDIITLEPNGANMKVLPASPFICELFNSLPQQTQQLAKVVLGLGELEGEYYEYYQLGYKKVQDHNHKRHYIAILSIPPTATISDNSYQKKRCSIATVKKILNIDTYTTVDTAYSIHDSSFEYRTDSIVQPRNSFDYSMKECGSGIHFFSALDGAINY